MPFARTSFVLAALALAACSSTTDADGARVVGLISIYNDRETPNVLAVPDTVNAGATFTAEVTTFGSSSCTRAAGAQTSMQGRVVEIVPIDFQTTGARAVCTDDLRGFPRSVALRIATAGDVVVRVRGVDLSGAPVTFERQIVVR